MPSKTDHLHQLEVPLIVELGRRTLKLREVMNLLPGAIVDLGKNADEELELLVNNETVATGVAVKVGENFGLRLTNVGSKKQRAEKMSSGFGGMTGSSADDDAAALAEQFLSGQDF